MPTAIQQNFSLRKSFAKIKSLVPIPNLIDIQRKSYEKFLQTNIAPEQREVLGLQAVFNSVFPIKDLFFHHRCVPGLLGAGLLLAWAAARRPWARAAVLLLLAAGTRAESRLWTDPPALERRDVRHAFHVATAWWHYARGFLDGGDPARAERLFRPPTRMPWLDSRALSGHARALMASGRREEARSEIAQGLARSPESTDLLGAAVEFSSLEKDEPALDRLADRLERIELLPPPLAVWLAGRRRIQGRDAEAERILGRHREAFPEDPLLKASACSAPRSGSPASR